MSTNTDTHLIIWLCCASTNTNTVELNIRWSGLTDCLCALPQLRCCDCNLWFVPLAGNGTSCQLNRILYWKNCICCFFVFWNGTNFNSTAFCIFRIFLYFELGQVVNRFLYLKNSFFLLFWNGTSCQLNRILYRKIVFVVSFVFWNGTNFNSTVFCIFCILKRYKIQLNCFLYF